ncbi:MAG: urate hydroxylase PuuD [Burkholderiales bacterium]|jgi:uncharacterized membrane protein|nr:urate hydroxylase PuuD [Burkholderiales bacterium]
MEAYAVDWLNLLVRWLHLTAGIAWIGASFYFVWLDNSLEKPGEGASPRVSGELWSVHGGGFYHNEKFLLGPEKLPTTLHWFKWEAYTTWLSGTALLAIVYWWGARTYLIDPRVADIAPAAAVALSAGTLVAGWLVYDALCRVVKNELALGLSVYALLVVAAFAFQQVFSARAAYIQVGAIIGTIMVWNVFFVIIPGQRRMVEAIRAGRTPDPEPGKRGKQRSVHNNYFTLPVLFIMVSNHYPFTYAHRHGWLVLAVIMAAGVLIRHFFNLRHRGRFAPWLLVAGGVLLVALAVAIAPRAPATASGEPAVGFADANKVIAERCAGCHAEKPTYAGFTQPPGGVMLDTPERIRESAARIDQQAVQTHAMPIGNLTNMTEAERALLGRWIASGAKID